MLHFLSLLSANFWLFLKPLVLGFLGTGLVQGTTYLLGLRFRRHEALLEQVGSSLAMVWYVGCFLTWLLLPWGALPAVKTLCMAGGVLGSGWFHWRTWEPFPVYPPLASPAAPGLPPEQTQV